MASFLCAAAAVAMLGAAFAQGQLGPLNDLFALGQGSGDAPAEAPIVQRPEPPFAATPAVTKCAPGARPQPGFDGRVPAGSAKDGLWCNLTEIGHQGTEGGFKVYRYVDSQGHECAYYDQTLLFPLNALNPGAGSAGVAVLDMSDPAHPKKTEDLTTTPMLSPHESLNLNPKRGLLAAVNGHPTTEPGFVSIYDVHDDCRHPVLDATSPMGVLGHEGGFSPDGKTFYATSTALKSITAIDVTNPKDPHAIWHGQIISHGMSLSPDGNRAYIADVSGNMLILDTSQIQARKPDPKTREISRLTWKEASIPQNAIPFTENGHPYILEIDEYTQGTSGGGDPDMVGAARIIDIADETKPFVVANLRLQIDQPAEHKEAANDPGASERLQGYAAHYCNIPTNVNPKLVACSFIASGLRLFDISDIVHPKEVGYFVAPQTARSENMYDGSNFAMSMPAFAPDRREIWWSNGTSGFYVLRVDRSVWPDGGSARTTSRGLRACESRARFRVKAKVPRGATVRRVKATLAGKRVKTLRGRHKAYAVVNLTRVPGRSVRLVIKVRLKNGRLVVTRRSYRACAH